MANGKSSDSGEYVIRSGVRAGLKREFAFAIKSQAQLAPSLGRTRSGKASPSPSPNANPNPQTKRIKKSSQRLENGNGDSPSPNTIPLVENPNVKDVDVNVKIQPPPKPKEEEREDVGDRAMEEEPVVENPLPPMADANDEGSEVDNASSALIALKVTATQLLDPHVSKEDNGVQENASGSVIDVVVIEDVAKVSSCTLENEVVSGTPIVNSPAVEGVPIDNYNSSDSKLALEDYGPATPPPPLIEKAGNSGETPVSISGGDCEGPKMENNRVVEKPMRRFTRSLLKVPDNEDVHQVVEDQDGAKDAYTLLDRPTRRFTRSLLKVPAEDTLGGDISGTISGGSVGSEEAKGTACLEDDSSSTMRSGKKMELKMSKKIALDKLPSNVRELLGTGLLEGMPVKYTVSVGKQYGLEGVIKGNGILCSCSMCKGLKVVSAYNFEVHAGSTKKHPSDYIILENGKSLHDVLRACTSVPLDMLESAIQNAIGAIPPAKPSVCQKCKKIFHTPRTGKFALMCDLCLEPNQHQTSPRPTQGTPSNAKLPSKVLAGDASGGLSKKTSSQKKSVLPTKASAGDASDSSSKNTSQKKIVTGKLTRKDLGLHKLVFMDDILPEGTQVGYYVRGQKLLEGYIKDAGINCNCCNSVVSPSQFEAHAGRASRRKPYNNIYTSNGVSLHELSVSLSKDRKLSVGENDDLCSICADGGDLLLCDLCPRAFHRECAGLSDIPVGDWYCRYCQNMHQREKCLSSNDNAIAAGRVAGVDPIEEIIRRSIRIVTTSTDIGGCVLCRCHDFSKSRFDNRTVMICDQCEKEYHVGCMKDHNMCDLKELPEGEWFCSSDCTSIHAALQELLRKSHPLHDVHAKMIRKKSHEKGLNKDNDVVVRWRLLSGKTSPADVKLLLSDAVTIFHESFDPIVEAVTGRDLIPSMVYGRNVRDQDFGGMYCAVLTVNSSVVSAGILRILGSEVAELPLVATNRESQGLGYFQSLFSCIEELLGSLKVKHFVLPSADETMSLWTKKFGFSEITSDQLQEYAKGARPMVFQGTSLLHKLVPPLTQACSQETQCS